MKKPTDKRKITDKMINAGADALTALRGCHPIGERCEHCREDARVVITAAMSADRAGRK